MKIGIIGSGAVGKVLGKAFLSEGNQVMLGSRNPEKEELIAWQKENPGAELDSFAETARFGELLVLATNGQGTAEAIALSGTSRFAGKVVIDATNPIAQQAPTNGVLHYFTNLEESLMERLQAMLPEAKLVKAFNSVGNMFMYKPSFPGGKPSMFICGNDAGAKKMVSEILDRFGWEPVDMGMVESARAIEPLCMLWCLPGMLYQQWTHAFKLLRL
jgi:predicted dinucleotide-binding enzyme